ncbi:MAG: hypothetical protein ACP5JN_03555 [Candidatus Micrarchaeia archaeon]
MEPQNFGEEQKTAKDVQKDYAKGALASMSKIAQLAKTKDGILYMLIFAVTITLAIYFRLPLLKYQGFYEPDGFYHYAVIKAAISNHFEIPRYLNLSGWPASTYTGEPHGLYWVTLFPYLILHTINPSITAYTIMRLIPVLFGVLDVIGAWLLARHLSKNKLFGFLVMLFVALSLGDAARTSALIYRGDGFITIFLILSLLFLVKVLKEENAKKRLEYAVLSGFFLSIGNFVWNGAPFATATYIFAFVTILLYAFALYNKRLLERSGYLLISMLIWYALVNIYKLCGSITSQTFTGAHFIVLLFLMLVGWYISLYFLNNINLYYKFVGTPKRRLAFGFAFLAAATLMIEVAMPSFVYEIFVGNGFITNGNNFAVTIEELQPPTTGFLFASFGALLFTTPMSIIIYLSTFSLYLKWLFWIMMLATFLLYFFMQIENDESIESAKAYIKFGANEMMLTLVSYYALTAYLQIHAVRFNSLLSVPLAIFSAYTLYWLIIYFKKYNKAFLYAGYGVIAALVLYTITINYSYSQVLRQADNINPQFLEALGWIKNNTPPNSVFLTLWPDGSPIEGWADRISVTDSVGSQNATKADAFALWLYNSSPDGQFLLSNINGKPDYLLVRYSWLLETMGIFLESNISSSLQQLYGYSAFTGLHEALNSTSSVFTFSNNNFIERTIISNKNNSSSIASYLMFPNGSISPVEYVGFSNIYNGSFALVKQTAYSITNNGLMLITYSPIPNPKMPINITGAFYFAPGLAKSNMIKLLYFCNSNECLWNNNVARLELVYLNPDTRIYKIVYNSTS